ncbi:MAG: hypothetical protein HFE63_07925 [Clostridiales bacterium]|nr:hypothetical protein [Clostridiales bacterium]
MKKRILILLMGVMLLTSIVLPISATTESLLWDNIQYVTGGIAFEGKNGNYSACITGHSDVDRITATATLYYKNTSGNWIEIPMDWSYDVSDDMLVIDENFTGVSGREYKVELNATVYMNGYGEPVSKTSTKVCK